jgi:hypothetical protein
MTAQKQESRVQLTRLNDVILSPAELWALVVVLAAFPAPQGWRLGDRRCLQRSELAPASDLLPWLETWALFGGRARNSFRNLLRECSSYLLSQTVHLKLAGHAFA